MILPKIDIGFALTIVIACIPAVGSYFTLISKHESLAVTVSENSLRVKEIKDETNSRLSRIEDKLDRLIEGQFHR